MSSGFQGGLKGRFEPKDKGAKDKDDEDSELSGEEEAQDQSAYQASLSAHRR